MTPKNIQGIDEVRFDADNLYLEEIITDLKVGNIRRLTPVDSEGNVDASRPRLYFAQAQVMSQFGPLPVSARIDATTLSEAIAGYPKAVEAGIEALMEEARELQRQEASRIVLPGADAASKILHTK